MQSISVFILCEADLGLIILNFTLLFEATGVEQHLHLLPVTSLLVILIKLVHAFLWL